MKSAIGFLWGLLASLPVKNSLWARVVSGLLVLSGRRRSVTFAKESGLFELAEGENRFFVPRRSRVRLFHRGIAGRMRFVEEIYSVPSQAVKANDIVIDCGANIGEFARSMEQRGAAVFAFEPETLECEALAKNLTKVESRAINLALWSSSGIVTLNHANETADSSVLDSQIPQAGQSLIRSITLDDWTRNNLAPSELISLLKLEAEGGEADILLGGSQTLRRTRYICADLGEPTRDQPNAVPDVMNLLVNRGFEVVSFNPRRCVAVFQNLNLTEH